MSPPAGPPSNSLKEAALKNPTLLGDPTSLKAETVETPNPDDESNGISAPSSPSADTKDTTKVRAATDMAKPQDTYASSSAPVMAPAPTEADLEDGAKAGDGEEKKDSKIQGREKRSKL